MKIKIHDKGKDTIIHAETVDKAREILAPYADTSLIIQKKHRISLAELGEREDVEVRPLDVGG